MSTAVPGRDDYADLTRLRDARWRRPQHDRRDFWVALAIALVLHLVAAWFVRDWMRLRLATEDRRDVIAVRLIDPAPQTEPVAPPPPLELPPQTVEPPRPVRRETPRVAASPAPPPVGSAPDVAPAEPPPRLRLYGADGKMEVSTFQLDEPKMAYSAPAVKPSRIMERSSPLPYTPTAFEPGWAPLRESAFGAFVRRNTVTKKWRTKWGGGFACSWSLIIGGCGWGYAPPNPEAMKKVRVDVPVKVVRADGSSEEPSAQ